MNKIETFVFEQLLIKANKELEKLQAQDNDTSHKNMEYAKRNAFQHAFISGYIFNLAGEDIALMFGYQKEILTKNDEIRANLDDVEKAYLDTNRDLWNNKMGIEYAKEGLSNEILAQKIYDNINEENSDFITDLENDNRRWNANSNKDNLWNIVNDEFSNIIAKKIKDLTYDSRDTDMTENMINGLHNDYNGYRGKFWEATEKSKQATDPIIFDLNGDNKLETTTVNNGVYFDHENDGFAEASAWVGENDGILVVDSNNNGEIDNGSELLTADNISEYDSNNDGIIDVNDADFNNLKIIKGDGTLMTLAEAGITSINLNTTSTEITDENGNQQFASGTFTKSDGTTGTFGEFLVSTDTTNSMATEWLEETADIENLPDIAGRGIVYSLHQAMRHAA